MRRIMVRRAVQAELSGQNVLSLEPRIDVNEQPETLDEQSGTNQQRKRYCNFSNHQRAADSSVRGWGRIPRGFFEYAEPALCKLHRRNQPEQGAGKQRY